MSTFRVPFTALSELNVRGVEGDTVLEIANACLDTRIFYVTSYENFS